MRLMRASSAASPARDRSVTAIRKSKQVRACAFSIRHRVIFVSYVSRVAAIRRNETLSLHRDFENVIKFHSQHLATTVITIIRQFLNVIKWKDL